MQTHHRQVRASSIQLLEMPTQMLTRDEQNKVLQNHIVAMNAAFNKVAVFEELIQREPHNTMYYKEVQ